MVGAIAIDEDDDDDDDTLRRSNSSRSALIDRLQRSIVSQFVWEGSFLQK